MVAGRCGARSGARNQMGTSTLCWGQCSGWSRVRPQLQQNAAGRLIRSAGPGAEQPRLANFDAAASSLAGAKVSVAASSLVVDTLSTTTTEAEDLRKGADVADLKMDVFVARVLAVGVSAMLGWLSGGAGVDFTPETCSEIVAAERSFSKALPAIQATRTHFLDGLLQRREIR